MLNLTYYQSIFNDDSTEIRCRRVLDEISPAIRPIFQRFVEKIGITIGDEYLIRNYDATLSTTYSDARNPNYAEKKKNSDIGRKYFVALNRKVNEREYNFLTLEFDGLNNMILIHSELNFIPFWAWVRNNQIQNVLSAIPEGYLISTGWKDRTFLDKEEFVQYVKGCIKPRKRPWFAIGRNIPLDGQLNEEDLHNELVDVWERLGTFRSFYNEEIETSKQAYDALMLLASTRNIKETKLLGRDYTVDISALEDYKSSGKRQAFYIHDGDQMLTKGFIAYLEYHDKNSPFQTIIVSLEGHNHIFTSAREILGKGKKSWWITKLFASHTQDNMTVMNEAMRLLHEHGIPVNGTSYCVGSYNNETKTFAEGIDQVKKNFIDASLLFAHAKEKLALPSEDEGSQSEDVEDSSDSLEPNFKFNEIVDMVSNSQFTFSKDIIRDLHLNLTALDDKHFVLLSGISGTGKTQLCRLYANAVYGLEYESENPYFTIIPVRPDWTDATALFGYYSSFEKRYVKTEFLTVLLNALKEREKPHFILLDEMNLARVEYYLSDYLSAVESRKEIPLHHDDTITDIPKKLLIPPNVYVLGTINVDETTHSISDKVLDRAFVMTLSDVDFDSYWGRVNQDMKEALVNEFQILKELHFTLSSYELHFGYRSMGEMLQKLYANYQLSEDDQMNSMEALDRVISEKVLTKIRGDERISEMLAKIEQWLERNLNPSSISLQHVKRMKEELEYYGATQFWR